MNVALVNEDQGGYFNKQRYNFGTDFVNLLTKDEKIEWFPVSRSVAERGIKHKNYDLIIILPHNFTQRLLQFQSPNFKQTDIVYKIRENKNINLRLNIEQQTNVILNTLNQRITNLYFASILFNLHQAQEQMDKITENELKLQGGMEGDINNPLKQLVENLKTNAENNKFDNDLKTNSPTNVLDSLSNMSDAPVDFSSSTNSLNDLSSSLDKMVAKIDDQKRQTEMEANQQLNALAQSGNSIMQQNNFQTLNFLSQQQGNLNQIMADNANYIALIQGDEVQTLISQLLNDPFLKSNQTNDDLVVGLSRQQQQITSLHNDLTKEVMAANPNYATAKNMQSKMDKKLAKVINQLPPNYRDILNEIIVEGYLNSSQINSLKACADWVDYYLHLNRDNVISSDQAYLANAQIIYGPEITLSNQDQALSFQLPDYLKLDIQNLLDQLQRAGFAATFNSQTGLITLQSQRAFSTIVRPQFVVDWPKFSLQSSSSWGISVSDVNGKTKSSRYNLNGDVASNNNEHTQNVVGMLLALNQAGTLLDFLYQQDDNQQSIMADVQSLASEQQMSVSVPNNTDDSLFKSLSQQNNNLTNNLDDIQSVESDKQLLRIRIAQLAKSLQSIYQQGIDMYSSHEPFLDGSIELNTDLLTVKPYQADFSSLEALADEAQQSVQESQTELNHNLQENQEQFRAYQSAVDSSQNALLQSLQDSEQLLSASQAAVGYIDAIQNNSSEVLRNGKSLVGQADSLLRSWSILNDKSKKYSDNFNKVMPNTKNDDNQARKMYNNMSTPLKMRNGGIIKNTSTIFPYFITLANIVIALFAGFLIVEIEKYRPKFKMDSFFDEQSAAERYFMPIICALSLALSGGVAYLSYPSVANYLSLEIWLVAETIIQMTLIIVTIFLLRQLKMTGVFIFFILLIQYIFFTPAIGVYVSNQHWLSKFLYLVSPFQRMEDQYTQIFETNTISIVYILILAVILIVGILINLKVKVANYEVDVED